MRVIAGRYGGRRLKAPKGRRTRPTSDRVREALFAMLGDIEDVRVLDLFAGTGALGIEALSRGAGHAVFVESDRGAIEAIETNIAALGLSGEQAQIRREHAEDALKRARKRKETYDLILIDPPYERALELGPRLSAALPGVLAPRARVAIESDRRAPLDLGLVLEKERRYGDTTIAIHRHA
ncbi:MAG TPA: 16S rRNA (guanine(966)-N(2))-methyltransferase RsmD [Solirubrobacteraceae bacterium]|jgi:16S rRNA (guanine966-N2)-methyltransferase|nr:16S rRNA (guanine(966)-N(2))-methyltransferase RsmD [Solirubrobacteraceae bacterium]